MKIKFRLPVKVRYFLYILLAIIIQSCIEYGQDYKYTYTAKITYQNGDIDTLTFGRESFKGNKVYVFLKIGNNSILGYDMASPCLMIGCGVYQTPVSCGVRVYEILNESKYPISNSR